MPRFYVASDWHGDYSYYVQMKQILKPEDKLYYLGDAVDRGPQPIKLFLALMQDPQVDFLMGNHEDMMYNYLTNPSDEWNETIWLHNGGAPTLRQFKTKIIRKKDIERFYHSLYNLKTKKRLNKIEVNNKIFFLSHAGFSSNPNTWDENNYLWDRKHINDTLWMGEDNEWIIHGHTPVPCLSVVKNSTEEEIELVNYINYAPHKIDIDLGSPWTKQAILLPLDNLNNPIVMYSKEELNV